MREEQRHADGPARPGDRPAQPPVDWGEWRPAAGVPAARAPLAPPETLRHRRGQVRALLASWVVYWLLLLIVRITPQLHQVWQRLVAPPGAARPTVNLVLTLDDISLVWVTGGPLVLTLLWFLLVHRRRR